MQPRRFLSSASNASRHLAPPSSLSSALPGPSRFPGCLEITPTAAEAVGSPRWANQAATSGKSRRLDFLYPSVPAGRPRAPDAVRPDGVRHIRHCSSVSFYDASFPPTKDKEHAKQLDQKQPPGEAPRRSVRLEVSSPEDAREQGCGDVIPSTQEWSDIGITGRTSELSAGSDAVSHSTVHLHDRVHRARAKGVLTVREMIAQGRALLVAQHFSAFLVLLGLDRTGAGTRTGSSHGGARADAMSEGLEAGLAEIEQAEQTLATLLVSYGIRTPGSQSPRLCPHSAENTRTASAPAHAGSSDNRKDRAIDRLCSELATQADRVAMATTIAGQLTSKLTTRPQPGRKNHALGFESSKHLHAALHLWYVMRRFQVPRTTAMQSSLIRAHLLADEVAKASRVYAAERRTWRSALDASTSVRPSTAGETFNPERLVLGRPSTVAFRDLQHGLANREEWLLSDAAHRCGNSVQLARVDYAQAIMYCCQLLADELLDVDGTAGRRYVSWLISAACRLDKVIGIKMSSGCAPKTSPSGSDVLHDAKLRSIARVIRACMRRVIGKLETDDASTLDAHTESDGPRKWQLPTLPMHVYNQVIHYCLDRLSSPELCRIVLLHLVSKRNELPEPDHVTFSIILRQATVNRFADLAKGSLMASLRLIEGLDASKKSLNKPLDESRPHAQRRGQLMLANIDHAIRIRSSHLLVSLISLVASSGAFLRRFRRDPAHIGPGELIVRLYPHLAGRSSQSAKRVESTAKIDQQVKDETSWPMDSSALRPRVGKEGRFAIYDPHVLTAALNLAAKAGKTSLALRVWRMIKRLSRHSYIRPGQVSERPWPVPVQAATILFHLLSRERRKAMKVFRPRGRSRPHMLRSSRRTRAVFALRWGLTSGVYRAGRSKRLLLRSATAHLVAKHEYRQLMRLWNLEPTLESIEAGEKHLWRPYMPLRKRRRSPLVLPDERFYDAVLNVFGRRAGMRGRTPNHRSRSESIHRTSRSQLLREVKSVAIETVAAKMGAEAVAQPTAATASASSCSTGEDLVTSTEPSQATSMEIVERRAAPSLPLLNSQGRFTVLRPDPFLVTVLIHMVKLELSVPLAFRWLLDDERVTSAVTPEQLAKATESIPRVGRFNRFRNPRHKAIGKVLQLRTAKAEEKRLAAKAAKKLGASRRSFA